MAIEVWNELGESVEDERGELVCVKPFPCMPTHFWDDDQGFKYKKGKAKEIVAFFESELRIV